MRNLEATITITPDGENVVSRDVLHDEKHRLRVKVDLANGDVYMTFTSREAIYDFAKSLLHEAVFGRGETKEFFPLIHEGKSLVVEGVRLEEGSSRMFLDVEQ